MNAIFVQVEDAEIARFEADPNSVEALFANQTLPATGLLNMTPRCRSACGACASTPRTSAVG